MQGAKTFEISKQLVMDAYQRVKANRGASGIDEVSIAALKRMSKAICTKSGTVCLQVAICRRRLN